MHGRRGNLTEFKPLRHIRSLIAFLVIGLVLGCAPGTDESLPEQPVSIPGREMVDRETFTLEGHVQAHQYFSIDLEAGTVDVIPDRVTATHLDLQYFWKYYPNMLIIKISEHDPDAHELTLQVIFINPLEDTLGDVRAIFPVDGRIIPLNQDGWSLRGGASVDNPDPYYAFGLTLPNRKFEPNDADTIEVHVRYIPPLNQQMLEFVLDATVDDNTAEPYEFGQPQLTGRLFHVAISDWQDDITTAFLDVTPLGMQARLRLAPFGQNGEWGTSIPDIPEGDHRLILTAESPETSDGDETAVAVQWVDLEWPPDDPIRPLPEGQGIYGYSFIDPDTNLPPTNAPAFIQKFREEMGGDWLIIEYGEICNSGYLAMHSWVPVYTRWMHNAAPDLPIHLNLDNLGFQSVDQDPCHHQPENYTDAFFNHLLDSIRGQILENPDFDFIEGIHLDIEIFPGQYSQEELFAIYARYADFLARLHLEEDLDGRVITVYEFDHHPHLVPGDLPYLCTTDAFLGEAYFSRFTWDWIAGESPPPFYQLWKILGTYHTWAHEYGRPYYPILATFSGWIDDNLDTLCDLTPCPGRKLVVIDDHCFGTGDFHTINEYDIVRAQDIHGMVVERVMLKLETGEDVFPANGFAVYELGDGDPQTESDDTVFCRTAYSVARALDHVMESRNPYMLGTATFRFENNSFWKAAAQANPLGRGDITAVAGQIRFGDGLDLQHHPELWGQITIELVDPLTLSVTENPAYMESIDIVGVIDGSFIFPDLPRAVVTIRAVAPDWESQPVTLDLTENFAYRDNVELLMQEVDGG
jgi:hypothetical protein